MPTTAAQKVELIDQAIEDVIVGGHSSYQIAGRSVTKHDLDKLRKMRNYYSQIAKREARGGGIRVKGSRPCH